MNNISFTNAQDFIDWVEHQRRFSPKVSLEKMRYYLSLFDNPHQKFSSIHITGTNGKGSVVAYLNSVLRTAGFNVATFTSPYITCFNERIRYNDQNISNEDLLRIANLILSKYDIIEQSGVHRDKHPSHTSHCSRHTGEWQFLKCGRRDYPPRLCGVVY